MRGNILVSCAQLGAKVQVLQSGGRDLDLIETMTGEGGDDLRPWYSKPSMPYKFEVRFFSWILYISCLILMIIPPSIEVPQSNPDIYLADPK